MMVRSLRGKEKGSGRESERLGEEWPKRKRYRGRQREEKGEEDDDGDKG